MTRARGFFGLSKEEVAEIAIDLLDGESGCRVSSSVGELFEIANCTLPDERREPSQYTTFICQTPHSGEQKTSRLNDPITGSTLGYIFPIASFRDGENFDSIWLRRFADVGFRSAATLDNLMEFGAEVSIDALRGRTVYLDEVLDDALSIGVLGNAGVENLEADPATLEFMLYCQGINIIGSRQDIVDTPPVFPWSDNSRLRKPGPLVASEAAVFLQLFKSADRDRTGVGAFMHLYQALEFCIDHIFGWGVVNISREELTTWEMKERLSRITGESHRLSLLDGQCLASLPNRIAINQLAEVCREFLESMQVDLKPDMSWHALLYKCRNIIVHNQIMMLKEPLLPLSELVDALRACALDVLFCFALPEPRHLQAPNMESAIEAA